MIPARIDALLIPIPHAGCLLWLGPSDPKGYGIVWFAGRKDRVHRVLWRLAGFPLRRGRHLDHKCRTTGCANPDHLEPVSNRENQRRRRRPTCGRGHAFTGSNLIVYRGRRYCRACANLRRRSSERAATNAHQESP